MKLALVLYISTFYLLGFAAAYQQYCKCQCASNYTIFAVDNCGNCTKSFCLTEYANICSEVAEDTINISCFQIESFKDQFIVYGFIVTVIGLLVYAVKGHRVLDNLR
ncbi:hypothetical protein BABINDRAFT_8787 [Babjeviella inositovora NRRL Y-12698]|uniref:Uncharacterized protein n=1 Tax=Babjeviella inositovora NRRL Y-12698 TaxID=984486 RepID=A0A1E3QNE1_9ASCO|nr:uncharacterized protein BABINDRAFT_8787 [Babjeviella inositovora NRRL Y-12698]ODQ79203.1 hypothetical protein BABINDRAFT_8787 [Babjeviella inositovora NRRL Y-12698]